SPPPFDYNPNVNRNKRLTVKKEDGTDDALDQAEGEAGGDPRSHSGDRKPAGPQPGGERAGHPGAEARGGPGFARVRHARPSAYGVIWALRPSTLLSPTLRVTSIWSRYSRIGTAYLRDVPRRSRTAATSMLPCSRM